jgi:hypothetical protein
MCSGKRFKQPFLLLLVISLFFITGCSIAPQSNKRASQVISIDGLQVSSQEFNEDKKDTALRYTIHIKIPQVKGIKNKNFETKLNQEIQKKIQTIILNFKKDIGNWDESPQESAQFSSLDVDYQITTISQKTVSLSFKGYQYMAGAAHPFFFYVSFNYDIEQQRELELADVFKKGTNYVTTISKLAVDKLVNAAEQQGQKTDREIIEAGVGPKLENFQNFTLSKEGITFLFDDGQAASRAEGEKQVLLNWTELLSIIDTKGPFQLLQ